MDFDLQRLYRMQSAETLAYDNLSNLYSVA